jgi:hypothetical protein
VKENAIKGKKMLTDHYNRNDFKKQKKNYLKAKDRSAIN